MTINNVKISPSIIASDLSNMAEIVKTMDKSIVDLLHMDVMDGNFVPNLTFGAPYVKNLQQHTDIPFDIHLMVERPENCLEKYIELNPWCITIHYESTRFSVRLLNEIKSAGIVPALAINPSTPVESVFDLVPYVGMVLIMSVDPGFYGQEFVEMSLSRIRRLKQFVDREGFSDMEIQVDGGITTGNIARIVESGASIVVAGSASFLNGNVNASVMNLKKSAVK